MPKKATDPFSYAIFGTFALSRDNTTPGGAPLGAGFAAAAGAGAGGGGVLTGAAGGPVLVVVVVVAAVVDAIVNDCCDRTVVKVLYCPVGVTRGPAVLNLLCVGFLGLLGR